MNNLSRTRLGALLVTSAIATTSALAQTTGGGTGLDLTDVAESASSQMLGFLGVSIAAIIGVKLIPVGLGMIMKALNSLRRG